LFRFAAPQYANYLRQALSIPYGALTSAWQYIVALGCHGIHSKLDPQMIIISQVSGMDANCPSNSLSSTNAN